MSVQKASIDITNCGSYQQATGHRSSSLHNFYGFFIIEAIQ